MTPTTAQPDSKAKHTAGPWEIEPKERRDYPLFVMDKEGNRIAKCDGLNVADFGPTPEQCKANARLISASPEMLEALKATVAYLDNVTYIKVKKGGDGSLPYPKALIESAIIAAEGRSK
jgi:hypothetical protein